MIEMKDEFLSQEDLDLSNMSWDKVVAYWNLWLRQAQATNDLDNACYSHGVFVRDPSVPVRHENQHKIDAERERTSVSPGKLPQACCPRREAGAGRTELPVKTRV
jgi:hypothetical protein